MSDFSARKTPVITVEPGADSKKLDKTKDKYDAVKKSARISVGTAPLPKETKSEFSIREGSAMKKLRISSVSEQAVKPTVPAVGPKVQGERALKPDTLSAPRAINRGEGKFEPLPSVSSDVRAPRRRQPQFSSEGSQKNISSYFSDDLKVETKPSYDVDMAALPDLNTYRMGSVVAAGLTAIWFLIAAVYVQFYMGWGEMFSQQPHVIGGFLAGILAPAALLWMIVGHMQRGNDVQQYTRALRDELKNIKFPTNVENNQVQAFDLTAESKTALNSIHKARAGLRDEIKYLNDVSEKTGVQLDKINNTLSDRATKLLNMTQEIEKRTESFEKISASKFASLAAAPASSSVTTSIPAVDVKSAQNILDKTDGISTKMQQRVNDLNLVLGKMEGTLGQIESKGASTADKLSKALSDSSSNANSLEKTIQNSIEKLTKASEAAKSTTTDLVEKSSEKIEELNKTGAKASEKVTSVLGLIDSSREKMEKTSSLMGEHAQKTISSVEKQSASMGKAQEDLSKRIDSMQIKISEPLAAVNKAVDNAVVKHEEMGQSLDKRIVELNSVSDKAVEKTDVIRDGLRDQTREMSTLMGQIAGHSRSVKAMLKDENESLSENINQALEKVNSVGDVLSVQSEKLDGVTANAQERIQEISDTLSSQSMNVVKGTGRVIGDFKTIEDLITQNVKSLLDKSGEATGAVQAATTELKKSAEIVEPVYQKATSQIDKARDRFEKMSSGFETRTNGNINKLKAFETLFDERLKTLSSSAEEASQILDRSSNGLGERVKDIDNATVTAEEKLKNIDKLFKNHLSDIYLTTDQALLKIDNIQKAMNTHYQDLSASVAESLVQMQDVGAQFVKQTEQVQKLSSGAVDGLDKAGSKAEQKVKNLNKLAKTTATQMEEMLQKVQGEAEELLKTSSKTLGQMKKTGEDFASRAKAVEDQMKSSVQSTKKYGDELDKQASKVSKTSERSAADIEKAMAQLAAQLLDVKQVSKDVTSEVVSNRDKLSSETEHFADLSLKASRVVEEAASSYIRQSGALSKATADAASHIDKVREGDWRVQRDAFLNSTRFVLESLHSLSVDLTRMVDGDIQEKTWKAYQAGDIAAFTRRLLDNKSKLPYDKMSKKYEKDHEFRTYTNRFIRQFEDMLEQANRDDYGDLISATFASSDVAGLYEILCEVSGRKSMIKNQMRRAA